MRQARSQRTPPAPSYRSQEERDPQGPLGKCPHGPAAPHRAALKVRQAAPHSALRGRDSRAQSSPPRARQPLALPRKSTRKASQRSLFLLEQYPEGTGTRRRAHSRPAAFIRQFSREFRPFAVRGPETAGHSDPRTTMRYAHLGQAPLLAAAETVSACLRTPPEEKQNRTGNVTS